MEPAKPMRICMIQSSKPCIVNGELLVFASNTIYLSRLCRQNHTTLAACQKASKEVVGGYKLPLLIQKDLYCFFPVYGKRNEEKCWLNYYEIEAVKKQSLMTLVVFKNGQTLLLCIDKRSISRQMKRCERILLALEKGFK